METFDIPVRCECGSVRGTLCAVSPSGVVRAICYCDDCQAFAHHLGRSDTVLDGYGGTTLFQVSPSRLAITQGEQHLACVRLTGPRLLRWYASCCGTPIGNTPASHKMHFLGLIHVFHSGHARSRSSPPATGASSLPCRNRLRHSCSAAYDEY